jgi:tyrosine-protein phosphatase SIW14
VRSVSRTARTLFLLLLALCASPAQPQSASQASSATHVPARRITVIGVSNFGEVTPKLLRGGQPTGKGYANLKKMGVDIVVDLRLSGKDAEKRTVTKAGMQFVSIPWHCLYPRNHVFAKFLRLLRENPDKKVFVHCRYGDDRTGMMIAAYRMAVQGWNAEDAAREMKKFGYHRLLCPPLAPYEESFPKRLQKSPEFEEWRSQSVKTR